MSSTHAPTEAKIQSERTVTGGGIHHDIDYFFRLLLDDDPQPITAVVKKNKRPLPLSQEKSLMPVSLLMNRRVRIPRIQSKNDEQRQSPPSSPRRRYLLRSSFSGSPRSVRTFTNNSCSRSADLTLKSYMWDEYDDEESAFGDEASVQLPWRLLFFLDRQRSDYYVDVHDYHQQQLADKNWFVVDPTQKEKVPEGNKNYGVMRTVFYDSSEIPVTEDERLPPSTTAAEV